MENQPFRTLEEFWPYYVCEHRQAGTRWLHFIGNTNLFFWLLVALLRWNLWIVLWAVISSYALAWIGHFFVEHNIPATFRYRCQSGIVRHAHVLQNVARRNGCRSEEICK